MIIAVTNLKGGCGKTTTSLALATAIARRGNNVVVFDCDPQASAWVWADAAERNDDSLPFSVVDASVPTLARKVSGLKDGCWAVIDCPPDGAAIDKAVEIADVIVVPTGTGSADMIKTWAVIQSLQQLGKDYAVLITQAKKGTVSLASAIEELEAGDASYFDVVIPAREDLKNTYGNAYGSDLYGYEAVLDELISMMD